MRVSNQARLNPIKLLARKSSSRDTASMREQSLGIALNPGLTLLLIKQARKRQLGLGR
ncbi:MAG: hypothetical protein Q8O37_09800 [Sulfuricellaceae bacterium]|nr:hypothetical protein [Sulfuricellaceae bacterium]